MERLDTVYTVDDFVRRVVESLLRARRGTFLCSRCLVKLTKENLDNSYARPDIVRVIAGIFDAPGWITHVPASRCAQCEKKKTSCLGVSLSSKEPK